MHENTSHRPTRHSRSRFLRAVMRVALGLLLLSPSLAQAGDPRLEWYTIDAGRFRVHFHGGLEPLAQRAALVATQLEQQLSGLLGSQPTETTEIVLSDSSDSANGFASSLPYAAVRLYVTAPDDMSALGEYDDWLSMLISHEDTHIVHIGSISGIPALINAVLGKQAVPNQMQPRWLIEGLAVYAETRLSGGGRLRSPAFDMMLRADVIDKNFASLDQVTGDPRRWPSGSIYYLYGSKFVEFIAQLYGSAVLAAAVRDSGDDVVPFAVSRPFYRATGRTIEQLYDAFRDSTARRVQEQLKPVQARGIREGRRLTFHGRSVSSPRFVPPRCRRSESSMARDAAQRALAGPTAAPGQGVPLAARATGVGAATHAAIYFRDDGHDRAGYYELVWQGQDSNAEVQELLVSRASGENSSVAPDCSLWFESTAPSARLYDFTDLFRQRPGTRAPSGVEASRERMTVGRRAMDPDVARDGHHIVYVTNRAGTTTLRIADIDSLGQLANERMLVASMAYDQVFTPRFSPDGKRVVYSAWSRGGYRDLRVVEIATGRVTELWKDRAIDQQPVFSPDGKWIYFSSDRTGISNIYAYEMASGQLFQVTNVRTGAFMPDISADGKQLIYVGYSARGYDLFTLPLERESWLAAPAAPTARDDRVILDDRGTYPIKRYSALPTLRPRALGLDFRSDTSGQRLILSTTGSDVVGLHAVSATAVFEPEGQSPDLYVGYEYGRLPFGFFTTAYRIVDPNTSYSYGSYRGSVDERRIGATTGIDIPFPREFDGQGVSVAYTAERVDAELPTGLAADPYAPVPSVPRRGTSSSLRLAYSFSNVEGSHYAIGRERGVAVRVAVDEAHRGLGSELEGTRAYARLQGYVLMPWLQHHVLALSGAVRASTGNAFGGSSLGGYQSSDLLRDIIDRIDQSRETLRGYPSGRFRGRRMFLGQAEYRFPFWVVDRGVSTLPVFTRMLGAAFGVDAGGAFNEFDPHAFDKSIHYGFASELWVDMLLGYRISTRFVLGYAAGFGLGAYDGGTGYLVIGSGL
jgi:hypothetical protein